VDEMRKEDFKMPKRSRFKKTSNESQALKRMRITRKLSQRKAAELIGVPPTTINHTENGRAYIRREYVKKFIDALEYSWSDWNDFLEGHNPEIELRESCKGLIDCLDKSRLDIVFSLLSNFTK
tara:strand:- start:62 stop:430 length:369 start_codon:yes stop_codon:yes gene_type:complete